MGVKMKNFDIMGAHWKIRRFVWVYKRAIYRGDLPKKGGAWTVYIFKGGLAK